MSLDISFESASSAIAYANDVLERALRSQHAFVPRDTGPMRRRLQRRMRESLPDTGPSLALARYALRETVKGQSHDQIARMWGCGPLAVAQSLAMWPDGKEQDTRDHVEQPDLFGSPCEPTSASL